MPLEPPRPNWYYRLFDIAHKEAFPLSASAMVFVTDFYHLAQFFFKIFLALAFVPFIGWIWAGVYWLIFGLIFSIVYKYLSK